MTNPLGYNSIIASYSSDFPSHNWISQPAGLKSDTSQKKAEAIMIEAILSAIEKYNVEPNKSQLKGRIKPVNNLLRDLPSEVLSQIFSHAEQSFAELYYVSKNKSPLQEKALKESLRIEGVKIGKNSGFATIKALKIFLEKEGKYVTNLDLSSYHNSDGNSVTGKDLEEILKLTPNLKSLNLRACKKITGEAFANLKSLTTLQSLDLSDCSIRDIGLEHLAKSFPELENLNLTNLHVNDAGLAHLKPLGQLRNLNLTHSNITDVGLAQLKDFKQLQNLDLDLCSITDEGLRLLGNLRLLERLSLNGCDQITDEGLLHLVNLSYLKRLDLDLCELITDTGRIHLKTLLKLEN